MKAGVLVTALCLAPSLLTACTSPQEPAQPSASVSSAPSLSGGLGLASPSPGVADATQLACRSVNAAQQAAPVDREVVLGDVALPTGMLLEVSPTNRTGTAVQLFAKQGLVVRAGTVVDLRVAPGWETRARIGWGQSPVSPALALHVPACPNPCHYSTCTGPDQPEWLHFIGGYFVDQPSCLPLIVTAQGKQTAVFISVGVACPGLRQASAPAA